MKLNRGSIALICAATIWGSVFVVTKSLLGEVGPFTLGALRFFVALIILIPFAYRQGYRFSLSLRPRFLISGLLGVTLYFAVFNIGLLFTSASNAALIQGSIPAVTALLSMIFLKERLSRLQILGITLSLLGLLLITGAGGAGGSSAPLLGDLLILGSVLAWAGYTVQGKKFMGHLPLMVSTTAGMVAGFLFLLPFAVGELFLQGLPRISVGGAMQLLYLGGAATALAYGLWNYGLKFMPANKVGSYINLVPVIGLLLGWIVLHEPLSLLNVGGGAVVLLGVWLSNRG
jgi:Predicted permease, DMT superfamily